MGRSAAEGAPATATTSGRFRCRTRARQFGRPDTYPPSRLASLRARSGQPIRTAPISTRRVVHVRARHRASPARRRKGERSVATPTIGDNDATIRACLPLHHTSTPTRHLIRRLGAALRHAILPPPPPPPPPPQSTAATTRADSIDVVSRRQFALVSNFRFGIDAGRDSNLRRRRDAARPSGAARRAGTSANDAIESALDGAAGRLARSRRRGDATGDVLAPESRMRHRRPTSAELRSVGRSVGPANGRDLADVVRHVEGEKKKKKLRAEGRDDGRRVSKRAEGKRTDETRAEYKKEISGGGGGEEREREKKKGAGKERPRGWTARGRRCGRRASLRRRGRAETTTRTATATATTTTYSSTVRVAPRGAARKARNRRASCVTARRRERPKEG